ncbi:MAG: hypothetical protein V3580_01330, partial [Candidatus Cardinium sp.]
LNDCTSTVLKKIDLIYREHPEYGYRYIYNQLWEDSKKLVFEKNNQIAYLNNLTDTFNLTDNFNT